MMGQSWQFGRVLGIPLKVHVSWFIVFVLITWSLGQEYFPAVLPERPAWQYWGLGAAAALLLFISVLVHELGHCVVAQRYRIPISQITLFIFGGMAQIKREAPTPKAEFLIAIAGPIVSALIALGFWAIANFPGSGSPLVVLSEHLGVINLTLALFNLVPGYPLDGGRVLRAGLWAWSKNYHRATQHAARAGQVFAGLLMIGGFWVVAKGGTASGLWFVLIGGFLYTAAMNSYRQVGFQESLAGLRVADVMTPEVVTLQAGDTLEDAVNQYFLRFGFESFPVLDEDGRLVGLLAFNDLKAIPRERWNSVTVAETMTPRRPQIESQSDESIAAALGRMTQEDQDRLVVTDGEKVVGLLSRSCIARFLELMQRQ